MKLIDLDVLKKYLENECRYVDNCCDSESGYAIHEVDAFLEEMPVVMQWVSVDNEKPKINQRVLIVNKASDVFEGMLTLSDGEPMWYRPSRINQPLHKFTHWMPLPPPPGK